MAGQGISPLACFFVQRFTGTGVTPIKPEPPNRVGGVTRIRPFLMFQGGTAASAIEMYLAAIPGATVLSSTPHPEPASGIMLAELDLAGLRVLISDSAIDHGFDFTPSSSLFVDVADRAELERLAAALGEGGATLMPLDDYGFSTAFAWGNDRFGVSWQLNLP